MGLAMVHGIVMGHGGVIMIDSRLGEGTRVDVYLPHHPGGEREYERQGPFALPTGNERLLVVDDEPPPGPGDSRRVGIGIDISHTGMIYPTPGSPRSPASF